MLPQPLREAVPAAGAALRSVIIFVAVLSVPLTAREALGLSPGELGSWIVALYGIPGLLSLWLVFRYRQPLNLTGNLFAIIFVVSLGGQFSYPELIGAFMLAGAAVMVLGVLRLTDRVADWVPGPVVQGLLAGAVLPFIIDIFTTLGSATLVAGTTLAAYLAGRWLFGQRFPAIFPAVVVGLAAAALAGQFGPSAMAWTRPPLVLTAPAFSLEAAVTVTPVLVVLITFQANLPSTVYMEGEGYEPPQRPLNLVSGIGTVVGSLVGPTGISLSLPLTSLVAGPQAGPRERRHWSVYLNAAALVLIALLAAVAVPLSRMIPEALLVTLAGLALVGVAGAAFRQMVSGSEVLGPLFAFVIALSDLSLWGLGPFFWALAVGIGVSLLLEGPGDAKTRAAGTGS